MPASAVLSAVENNAAAWQGGARSKARYRQVVPHYGNETIDEERKMSLGSNPRKLLSPDEHRARIAAALRRRLYPNTVLHANALADAIGVTPTTVGNWRNGYSDPGSFEIAKLTHFFTVIEGSPAFMQEVFAHGS